MAAKKLLILLSVFVIFAVAIIFVGYFITSKSSTPKPPEALTISEPMVLWTDNRTLSLLFKIENRNKNYASNNFSYKINLFDDHNNLVKSIQKSLFIYAGQTETLVESKIDTGGNLIGKAEVEIENINWLSASDFKQPAIKTESLDAARENNFYKVSAKIYNSNGFDISKIVFCAVLYTKSGQELAVSRMDSDSIKAQRSKGLIAYLNISPSMEPYLDLSATKFYIYVKK